MPAALLSQILLTQDLRQKRVEAGDRGRSPKYMTPSILPDPPRAHLPASDAVRRRWIGRFVRMGRRHMQEPHPRHPEAARIRRDQAGYRACGVGEILDVGLRGWFLVRWENDLQEEQNKVDLDVYPDRATAVSYGLRLHPKDA